MNTYEFDKMLSLVESYVEEYNSTFGGYEPTALKVKTIDESIIVTAGSCLTPAILIPLYDLCISYEVAFSFDSITHPKTGTSNIFMIHTDNHISKDLYTK